jgi:hypothetical protein
MLVLGYERLCKKTLSKEKTVDSGKKVTTARPIGGLGEQVIAGGM